MSSHMIGTLGFFQTVGKFRLGLVRHNHCGRFLNKQHLLFFKGLTIELVKILNQRPQFRADRCLSAWKQSSSDTEFYSRDTLDYAQEVRCLYQINLRFCAHRSHSKPVYYHMEEITLNLLAQVVLESIFAMLSLIR